MGSSPFYFLDLPQEIRDQVYEKYFESEKITATYVESKTFLDIKGCANTMPAKIVFNNMPSLGLERTSRKVCQNSRQARNKVLPRTLLLKNMECPSVPDFRLLCTEERYAWIRHHIDSLILKPWVPLPRYLLTMNHYSEMLTQFPNVRNVDMSFGYENDRTLCFKTSMVSELSHVGSHVFKGWIKSMRLSDFATMMGDKYGQTFKISFTFTLTKYFTQPSSRLFEVIQIRHHSQESQLICIISGLYR